MTKAEFRNLLRDKGGCAIQYTGWTCGSCFFAINDKLNNKDWQTILYYRGDYKKKDLDNLPKDTKGRIERIIKILKTS